MARIRRPLTQEQKLAEFVKRNPKRNSSLYLPNMVEGEDYLICPESNQRLSMIKKSYITKILGMTVEDYDNRHPGLRGSTPKRRKNIAAGLSVEDPETGKKKHEISAEKAKETLSRVDETTGLTGYAKKGLKTRATHMANIDEHGRNGFERLAHYRVTTVLEDGRTVEQRAHERRLDRILAGQGSTGRRASKISKKVLAPAIELLREVGLRYYFDHEEFGVRSGKRHYFYDLVVPELKLAVEYQSFAYHADPWLSEDEWSSWRCVHRRKTATEALTYDYEKARTLWRERGYQTYHVWERSVETDMENLLCLLKTMITKSLLPLDGRILEV